MIQDKILYLYATLMANYCNGMNPDNHFIFEKTTTQAELQEGITFGYRLKEDEQKITPELLQIARAQRLKILLRTMNRTDFWIKDPPLTLGFIASHRNGQTLIIDSFSFIKESDHEYILKASISILRQYHITATNLLIVLLKNSQQKNNLVQLCGFHEIPCIMNQYDPWLYKTWQLSLERL